MNTDHILKVHYIHIPLLRIHSKDIKDILWILLLLHGSVAFFPEVLSHLLPILFSVYRTSRVDFHTQPSFPSFLKKDDWHIYYVWHCCLLLDALRRVPHESVQHSVLRTQLLIDTVLLPVHLYIVSVLWNKLVNRTSLDINFAQHFQAPSFASFLL